MEGKYSPKASLCANVVVTPASSFLMYRVRRKHGWTIMEGNNNPRDRLAALNVAKNRQTAARWMYYISSGSSINRRRKFIRRHWMQGPICVPSGACIGSSRTSERFVNAATNCGIRPTRSRNYRARSRNQVWSWWDITKLLGPPNGRTFICTSSKPLWGRLETLCFRRIFTLEIL